MLDISPVAPKKDEPATKEAPKNAPTSPYPSPMTIGEKGKREEPAETLEFLAGSEDNSKLLFMFTVIVAVFVIIATGYVFYLKSVKTQELATKQKENDNLAAQLKIPQLASIEDTATRYSGGLKSLNALFSSNVAYSDVFSAFEKLTPNEVIWQNFSIDEQNQIKISANANSLDDSAKFVKALKSADFITNLNLDSDTQVSAQGQNIYTVTITATFLPDKLIATEVTNAGS